MEISIGYFRGSKGWTIDFRTESYTPVPENIAEPRTLTTTTTFDPLLEPTQSTGGINISAGGIFVYDRTGTSVQNEDGTYTATYEETVNVSESTIDWVDRYSAIDIPAFTVSFEDGIPLADVIGKSIQALMTDGTVIVGSTSDDKIASLRVSETILAGDGNDKVDSRGGADILDGGTGNDRLTGGGGADIFVFGDGYERDVIVDFDARGPRHDKIELSGLSDINGFKDLKQHHLEQHGDDVWVRAGDDVLVIRDIEISDLRAHDFTF